MSFARTARYEFVSTTETTRISQPLPEDPEAALDLVLLLVRYLPLSPARICWIDVLEVAEDRDETS